MKTEKVYFVLFLQLVIVISFVSARDRVRAAGIIIPSPAKETSAYPSQSVQAYDPTGKKETPTSLPNGVTIPTESLGAGKVVQSQKKPSSSETESSSSEKLSHQSYIRPSNAQLQKLIKEIAGINTNKQIGVNIDNLPPNTDVQYQVIRPFHSSQGSFGSYSRPRPLFSANFPFFGMKASMNVDDSSVLVI